MIDLSPAVGLAPAPAFVPPPPPMAPPVGIPGLGSPTPGLPDTPTPAPNPWIPRPLEPSGIPPLPLPSQFGEPVGLFKESGIPQLPLPASLSLPGVEVVTQIPPPFSGGQCQGVEYRVVVTGRNANGVFSESFRRGDGPVVGPCFGAENAFGNTSIGAQFANGCRTGGGGQVNTKPRYHSSFKIASVQRLDGLPDDCGDPPPIREEVRAPNPARAFQPSPIRPFPTPRVRPTVLPEVSPSPQLPPLPTAPPTPAPEPLERPDRRVPGPPLPISPISPPEVVPFTPGTIPELPVLPGIAPLPSPGPSRVPQLPPFPLPSPPPDPTKPAQFPPTPPTAPTKQTPPVVVEPPPLVRVPPPFDEGRRILTEILRQGDSIRRILLDLADCPSEECVDLCQPASMLDISCSGGDGTPVVTTEKAFVATTLSSALGRLSRQVFEIAQFLNICDTSLPEDPQQGSGCGPGQLGPVIYSGVPPGQGVSVPLGSPPEGQEWVGVIARYVPAAGVGTIPSPAAPSTAYTQVVGNLAMLYGAVSGEAKQVRSEWVEALRPGGAPNLTGVYACAIPQCEVSIWPLSVIV